ncbi:MAG: DUF4367 domain-containing protein [Clostridia bacterium]|nr:DUF4367 domain-containing protein [Clostridia bacterium]
MNRADKLDNLLTLAIREVIREDWEAMTSVPDIPPVSGRCSAEMNKVFSGKRKAKSGHAVKRIVIGILAALFVLAMLGMAIRPVREALFKPILTWYDTHFGVRYEIVTEPDEPLPTVIEEVILPAWLPDGWSAETMVSTPGCIIHFLSDGTGDGIIMEQYPIDPGEESGWFDNTDVTIETITLNGRTEAMLLSYADGIRSLTWTDRYEFVLSWASEQADADILIRIAESTKPSKQ